MVGDVSGGLWTAVANAAGNQQIVMQVNPRSGALGTIASITPGYASPADLSQGSWQAVTLNGSMFLLDPPARSSNSGSFTGFSALYRINLATGTVSHASGP